MYNFPVHLYLRSNLTARAPGCHFYPTCISSFERFDAFPFLTTILFSYYSLTMASRVRTALSKISSWGRSGLSSISSRCTLPSWMKKAHDQFPPHPGIERNQLRGIFQYEYTRDEAQYFSFIGETRNDDPIRVEEALSGVFPLGTYYRLDFLDKSAHKNLLELTPHDLEHFRQSKGPTHVLTPLSNPNKSFLVKILSTAPTPPTMWLSVAILSVQTAGKKPKTYKRYKRYKRYNKSRRRYIPLSYIANTT
jgi:hypothetical protein